MEQAIQIRPYQPQDRSYLEAIIRKTWNYDRFCQPEVAAKMARVYLASCLTNQTFTAVAVEGNRPVGIVMGKNRRTHRCPVKLYAQWLAAVTSLLLSKQGRQVSKMFGGVDGIDQELLKKTGVDYPGELAFFAIDESCRGKGLGRKLFEALVRYMQSQDISRFYLFTDTSCNYAFYEHLGMMRQAEKQQTIQAGKEQGEMTFFLYDYTC